MEWSRTPPGSWEAERKREREEELVNKIHPLKSCLQ
jgi:hypothetical protein